MTPVFSSEYKTYINHTDAGGIVYHANYLIFYENCRRDWFTELGFDGYFLTAEVSGETNSSNGSEEQQVTYHPVVSKADIRYYKPILLDMKITVTVDEVRIKPASLVFCQSIFCVQTVNKTNNKTIENKIRLSSTEITIACVKNEIDKSTGKNSLRPARIPKHLVEAITQASV